MAALEALKASPEAVVEHGAAIVQRLEDSDANVLTAALEALEASPEAVVKHGAAIVQRFDHSDADVRWA
eukprot:5799789-Prymnesium_polylepis.1